MNNNESEKVVTMMFINRAAVSVYLTAAGAFPAHGN